jgi:hypothetical protein
MIVNPEIKKLIPADFIELAEKNGVKKISTSSWLYAVRRFFGFFDPENKEILIDLTKGERLLELYQAKYPELNLVVNEVYLFLFLHELAHANGCKDERGADEWAVARFKEWRSETKKKIIEAIQEGIREGFKARAV